MTIRCAVYVRSAGSCMGIHVEIAKTVYRSKFPMLRPSQKV